MSIRGFSGTAFHRLGCDIPELEGRYHCHRRNLRDDRVAAIIKPPQRVGRSAVEEQRTLRAAGTSPSDPEQTLAADLVMITMSDLPATLG